MATKKKAAPKRKRAAKSSAKGIVAQAHKKRSARRRALHSRRFTLRDRTKPEPGLRQKLAELTDEKSSKIILDAVLHNTNREERERLTKKFLACSVLEIASLQKQNVSLRQQNEDLALANFNLTPMDEGLNAPAMQKRRKGVIHKKKKGKGPQYQMVS